MVEMDKSGLLILNDAHAQPSKIGKAPTSDDFTVRFWFAVLFGLKEVIMKSDDLEVRTRYVGRCTNDLRQVIYSLIYISWYKLYTASLYSLCLLPVQNRALNYLFEAMKENGMSYSLEFWDTISRQIIFPIFDDLKPNSEHRRSMNQEDLSVWLSTTMIQALRNVIDLYTFHFTILRNMMGNVLKLLSMCITQGMLSAGLIDLFLC